jgi:hypothetical protein
MGLKTSTLSVHRGEARKYALAQVSRLLSSREALDAFCKDLFETVSDGEAISPSGLQALTKLVVDACQVKDPAMLQQLLDVLAPLPCSVTAEETSPDLTGLTFEGFKWYTRSVLRVVDAELRAEEVSSLPATTSSSTSEPMHEPWELPASESPPGSTSPATMSIYSTTSGLVGESRFCDNAESLPLDAYRDGYQAALTAMTSSSGVTEFNSGDSVHIGIQTDADRILQILRH